MILKNTSIILIKVRNEQIVLFPFKLPWNLFYFYKRRYYYHFSMTCEEWGHLYVNQWKFYLNLSWTIFVEKLCIKFKLKKEEYKLKTILTKSVNIFRYDIVFIQISFFCVIISQWIYISFRSSIPLANTWKINISWLFL